VTVAVDGEGRVCGMLKAAGGGFPARELQGMTQVGGWVGTDEPTSGGCVAMRSEANRTESNRMVGEVGRGSLVGVWLQPARVPCGVSSVCACANT
jgi:hypothetical protein